MGGLCVTWINIIVGMKFGWFSCSLIAIIAANVRGLIMGAEGIGNELIGAGKSGLEIDDNGLFPDIFLLKSLVFLC